MILQNFEVKISICFVGIFVVLVTRKNSNENKNFKVSSLGHINMFCIYIKRCFRSQVIRMLKVFNTHCLLSKDFAPSLPERHNFPTHFFI